MKEVRPMGSMSNRKAAAGERQATPEEVTGAATLGSGGIRRRIRGFGRTG
jgi:hypothetical protein